MSRRSRSDRMARAVAAGSSLTVEIGGVQCSVRPLSLRELTEVERDCVERFRRGYLKTFADNIDLVPAALREPMMQEKFEQAARWDVDDLPVKFAYDSSQIVLTNKLKAFVGKEFGIEEKSDDTKYQRTAASALDQGTLSEAQYEELSGKPIEKAKIPYVSWWITGAMDGMITFIWMAFKHAGVTREQVSDAMADNPALLTEVANEIERLSAPKLGNG